MLANVYLHYARLANPRLTGCGAGSMLFERQAPTSPNHEIHASAFTLRYLSFGFCTILYFSAELFIVRLLHDTLLLRRDPARLQLGYPNIGFKKLRS